MARRKWRGIAKFDLPLNTKKALMTICPGEPNQEGQKFKAIIKEAAKRLDHLYIVEASDLAYHNFKRLIPKCDAKQYASMRGKNWIDTHLPVIEEHMPGRYTIIPFSAFTENSSFQLRSEIIRNIYQHGNNDVTRWFDYSIHLDLETRAQRKKENGIIIEPWALKANSLDYLCDEYAARSLMHKEFGLDEIYLGLAVDQSNFFQKLNYNHEDIDLTIPQLRPIKLIEFAMIHDRDSGQSTPVAYKQLDTNTGSTSVLK